MIAVQPARSAVLTTSSRWLRAEPPREAGSRYPAEVVGTGFGTTTDIVQGPDGALYVVSITDNAIYKISRR
jgi:hypothetical protein